MAQQFTFPQNGDRDDAEHFASMIGKAALSDYVEEGMTFTPDYTVPDVNVSTGKAFVSQPSATAPSSGDTILELSYVVQVPAQTVSLSDNTLNYIYLEPNLGTDDSGTINAYTTQQSDPALLIGTVDTSSDTNEQLNRDVKAFGDDDNLYFGENNDYSVYFDTATGTLSLDSSGNRRLAIDSSGNLDIEGTFAEDSSL